MCDLECHLYQVESPPLADLVATSLVPSLLQLPFLMGMAVR